MNITVLAVICFILHVCGSLGAEVEKGNGGMPCISCDVIVRIVDVDAIESQESIEQAVEKFCNRHFNGTWIQLLCDEFVSLFGGDIINYLGQGLTPDEVCLGIGLCINKTCTLFPKEGYAAMRLTPWDHKRADRGAYAAYFLLKMFRSFEDGMSALAVKRRSKQDRPSPRLNPWEYIDDIINKVFDQHLPLIDDDGDRFSTISTFRGADWRGRDCDDGSEHIYPGRQQTSFPANVDHNCNGISGSSGAPGDPSWEQVLCGGSQQRGVLVLGDSASAHFSVSIPNANANFTTPADYEKLAENEADWPECSWGTGFYSNASMCPWSPLSSGVDSLYLEMWKRNRCNFRDFQSISVDGARSTSMNSTIVHSVARNQTADSPLLVFYALVGNDVCNGHIGYEHMTYPPEFRSMVMSTMHQLDQHLPAGSHVFFVGLDDGYLMWDYMSNATHPLGVTYADVWEFTNCYQFNACWGWLNPDENVRMYTQQLAWNLTAVLQEIAETETFKHFEAHFLGSFQGSTSRAWVAQGGNPVDLYEAVDGGHPSQLSQELQAVAMWQALVANFSEAIGPVNPNNDLVARMFGNQGGY